MRRRRRQSPDGRRQRSPERRRRRSRSRSPDRRRRRSRSPDRPTSFARARARMYAGEIDADGKALSVSLPPPSAPVEENDEPPPPGLATVRVAPLEPSITREEATEQAIAKAQATLAEVDALLADLYNIPGGDFAEYARHNPVPVIEQ